MASKNSISHAEIWDDTILVDSWNEALEEYKRYHSIKAKGENAEEVLRAAEKTNPEVADVSVLEEGQFVEPGSSDQRAKGKASGKSADYDTISSPGRAPSNSMHSGPAQSSNNGTPALPQHLAGQVHDEGLKNLLLSWYYAGYYTGLYEGQQQERAETSAKHEA